MKVQIERRDATQSTLVVFTVMDDELRGAEIRSRELGGKRPPRLDVGTTANLFNTKDWLLYLAWLVKVQLTF